MATALPVRSPLERGRVRRRPCGSLRGARPDRREFGAAQRAGEADREERAVAQAAEVVRDGGQDVAQEIGGGGEFLGRALAVVGGVAMDAGHGGGDPGFGGRHGTAGEEVEGADRRPAQIDGIDREATAALRGEEGDDVLGAGGQAGEGVAVAEGAPGRDPGAVGAAGVRGLGAMGVGPRGEPCRAQGFVIGGNGAEHGVVEPVPGSGGAPPRAAPAGPRSRARGGGAPVASGGRSSGSGSRSMGLLSGGLLSGFGSGQPRRGAYARQVPLSCIQGRGGGWRR